MRDQTSRCNPTAGGILDSLALIPSSLHSKNEILKQKNKKDGLQSYVTILYQNPMDENDSRKSDAFVRASRLPSEQVQKNAIIPYTGKKRSRVDNEPTGIMALVCQEQGQRDKVVSQSKRRKSSPRKSESTPNRRLCDQRHEESTDISSEEKSDLDQTQKIPRKSIPRRSVRHDLVHQTILDNNEDGDDIEFDMNGDDDASSTQANEVTSEHQISSKVITPSPKRKLVRKSVERDGRNILNDMHSSVESNSKHVNVNQSVRSVRRKKRVRQSRNKRLTLALAKSVTVGKKTIPSRATVTPDLRPVVHGDKDESNIIAFTKENNGKIGVIKSRKGRKEQFIGVPPSEANSTGKHEKNALDTIEELSKRVEENRKIAQIGINLNFEKSQSSVTTQLKAHDLKDYGQRERSVRDIVSYMDQLIHQIEELKKRVQNSDGVDLISIKKLKRKCKLPSGNDLFIENANTSVLQNLKNANMKKTEENGRNEAASPPTLSRSKRDDIEWHHSGSEKDEMKHSNERENRKMVHFSESDDSSVESYNNSARLKRSDLSKEQIQERRMVLLQQNDTLVRVGVVSDSRVQINKTSVTSVVSVSSQYCKRPESELTLKPCKTTIPSFLDGIDRNEFLERRWREEEARALIVAEREKLIPENDSDSESDSEASLSLFL